MANINERVFLDEQATIELESDLASWTVKVWIDADGHLNLQIQDGYGGAIENIREETNVTSDYEELLLRYTSDAIEKNYQEQIEYEDKEEEESHE